MRQTPVRVLIVGGYGTFGGWVARLLAAEHGLHLLIGGRSLASAEAFVAAQQRVAGMTPVTFDRDGDVTRQLADPGVDILIDASGPFQDYGDEPYRVAKACIASNVNYLDLADASRFANGIECLQEDAAKRGVFALSGVSTCVALTSAVYRSLSVDLRRVSIQGGIAPSPYSGVGRSVMRAVALSAGKPARAIRD